MTRAELDTLMVAEARWLLTATGVTQELVGAFRSGYAAGYRDGLGAGRQDDAKAPSANSVRIAKNGAVEYDPAYNCSRSQDHVSAFPSFDRVLCPECRGSYISAGRIAGTTISSIHPHTSA